MSRDGVEPRPVAGVLERNIATFVRLLRRAGIPVTLGQSLDFLRALEWIDLGDRTQVAATGRALLVHRREDLRLYDVLFERFWWSSWARPKARPTAAPRAPRHDVRPAQPFTIVNYLAYKAKHLDREIDVTDRSATFTSEEVLQTKEFSTLDDAELAAVRRLIDGLDWRIAERRTRRRERCRRGGRIDLPATLRAAGRHRGVPLRLIRARRRIKPRPLVVLADVSGSMEKLSRLVLQCFYGLCHGLGDVEAFLFGTRLTRVTPALRLRNIDQAIDAAARAVPDWSGGTRIGDSLRTFQNRWGRRVLRRGAVVVLISDGWERGDATLLQRQTRRLQQRCHRLIWLNPLAGDERYQPLVEGMAAALPYVDDFLPVNHLQSLSQLADHLASLPSRRRGPGRPQTVFPAEPSLGVR